jgi:hypothetical protein
MPYDDQLTVNGYVTRERCGQVKFHIGSAVPGYVHAADSWVNRHGSHVPVIPLYPGDPTAELMLSKFGFLRGGSDGCVHVNIRMDFQHPTKRGPKKGGTK